VIKSFGHKGLKKFFETGSKAGIQPKHERILRQQLTALNAAKKAEEMDVPGWGWHALKGDRVGHFAVFVNANWRLTFQFEGEDAILVDYQDYH
jgi:proteic killer suppression protein